MTRVVLLGLAAAACTGTPSFRTDLGPADPTGSDTGTDTPYTPPELGPADISFQITGTWEGQALTIMKVGSPNAPEYTDLQFGDVLTSTPVTAATVPLTLDPLDDSALEPIPTAPSVQWAVYHVALHQDDGNTLPDPGEVYTAVARSSLVFIKSEERLPTALLTLGFQQGWNAAPVVGQPSVAQTLPLQGLPIEVHAPQNDIRLEGTYEPFVYKPKPPITGDTGTATGDTGAPYEPYDLGEPRLVVAPGTPSPLPEDSPATLLLDRALDLTWSIDLTGAPPTAHRDVGTPLPGGSVLEYPMSYFDIDGSETFNQGDFFDSFPCDASGDFLRLLWVEPSDDRGFAAAMQGRTGWLALMKDLDLYGGYYPKGKYPKGKKPKGKYPKGKKPKGKYPYDYDFFGGISLDADTRVGTVADLRLSIDCWY